MQDIIEAIIHKAAVRDLQTPIRDTGLSIGDPAELHLCDDGSVAVWGIIRKRSFFFRRAVLAHLGFLAPQASAIVAPALLQGETLRVRVVGLTPEHLATDGKAEMHVSVWGNLRHIMRSSPAQSPA